MRRELLLDCLRDRHAAGAQRLQRSKLGVQLVAFVAAGATPRRSAAGTSACTARGAARDDAACWAAAAIDPAGALLLLNMMRRSRRSFCRSQPARLRRRSGSRGVLR